ncbi:hypothetical protein J6590_017828 [Homalodisca vitripennis]|nr:hypothetical protein J6590_017828 [Homalodisca vitripennis]
MCSLLSPLSRTRSATDAASPTPPASDSPPACSTPGPDPALSATPSRSSTSISSPAGETTAFHASTGEKPTPVAATKPDLPLLKTHSKGLRLSPRREPLMLTNLRQKMRATGDHLLSGLTVLRDSRPRHQSEDNYSSTRGRD